MSIRFTEIFEKIFAEYIKILEEMKKQLPSDVSET